MELIYLLSVRKLREKLDHKLQKKRAIFTLIKLKFAGIEGNKI